MVHEGGNAAGLTAGFYIAPHMSKNSIDNMSGIRKRVESGKLQLRKKGGTYGSKDDPQDE